VTSAFELWYAFFPVCQKKFVIRRAHKSPMKRAVPAAVQFIQHKLDLSAVVGYLYPKFTERSGGEVFL